MTGRAYVLGGSAEPSLAEMYQEMSEVLDKQVNAQKEKTSGVHTSSRKPMKKLVMKMKQTRKTMHTKNVIDERRSFIGCL